jgi:hypothetical protein
MKDNQIGGSEGDLIEAAVKNGVKLVYWNYLDGGSGSPTIADPLGTALRLEPVPYGKLAWTQFLDDLITLAYRYGGLAIVVDRADVLLRERPDDLFSLIEAFLIQVHHWYDQKKPCHLIFQMKENHFLQRLLVPEASNARSD